MQQGARPPGGKAAASHRSDTKRKAPRNQPTSFYKGLAWDKHEGCWRVRVSLSGKQHHLGRCARAPISGLDGDADCALCAVRAWARALCARMRRTYGALHHP
jgi:hypothetical protein